MVSARHNNVTCTEVKDICPPRIREGKGWWHGNGNGDRTPKSTVPIREQVQTMRERERKRRKSSRALPVPACLPVTGQAACFLLPGKFIREGDGMVTSTQAARQIMSSHPLPSPIDIREGKEAW